jgi:hypothetical protein
MNTAAIAVNTVGYGGFFVALRAQEKYGAT